MHGQNASTGSEMSGAQYTAMTIYKSRTMIRHVRIKFDGTTTGRAATTMATLLKPTRLESSPAVMLRLRVHKRAHTHTHWRFGCEHYSRHWLRVHCTHDCQQ